jgi:hypothetical protein
MKSPETDYPAPLSLSLHMLEQDVVPPVGGRSTAYREDFAAVPWRRRGVKGLSL